MGLINIPQNVLQGAFTPTPVNPGILGILGQGLQGYAQAEQENQKLKQEKEKEALQMLGEFMKAVPEAQKLNFLKQNIQNLGKEFKDLTQFTFPETKPSNTLGALAAEIDPNMAKYLPADVAAQPYDPSKALETQNALVQQWDKAKSDAYAQVAQSGGFSQYLQNPQNVQKASDIFGTKVSPGYKPSYDEILTKAPDGNSYSIKIPPDQVLDERKDLVLPLMKWYESKFVKKDPAEQAKSEAELKKLGMTPQDAANLVVNSKTFTGFTSKVYGEQKLQELMDFDRKYHPAQLAHLQEETAASKERRENALKKMPPAVKSLLSTQQKEIDEQNKQLDSTQRFIDSLESRDVTYLSSEEGSKELKRILGAMGMSNIPDKSVLAALSGIGKGKEGDKLINELKAKLEERKKSISDKVNSYQNRYNRTVNRYLPDDLKEPVNDGSNPPEPPTKPPPDVTTKDEVSYAPAMGKEATDSVKQKINQYADKYGVPREILTAMASHETIGTFNPSAYHKSKGDPSKGTGPEESIGLFQVNKLAPAIHGYDFNKAGSDVDYQIESAAKELKSRYETYKDWNKVVQSWNGSGKSAYNYAQNVMSTATKLKGSTETKKQPDRAMSAMWRTFSPEQKLAVKPVWEKLGYDTRTLP